MVNYVSLEEAKARAKALRPYVREAKRQGVQLTGKGKELALTKKFTPQELAKGGEEVQQAAAQIQTKEQTQQNNPSSVNNYQQIFADRQSYYNPASDYTAASPQTIAQTEYNLLQSEKEYLQKQKNSKDYVVRRRVDEIERQQRIITAPYEKKTISGGYVEVKQVSKIDAVNEALTVFRYDNKNKLVVTAPINDKAALFIEEKVNKPYLTALELTALKYAPTTVKTVGTKVLSKVGLGVAPTVVPSLAGGIGVAVAKAGSFATYIAVPAAVASSTTTAIKYSKITQQEAKILRNFDSDKAISEAYEIVGSQRKGFIQQAGYGLSQFLAPKEQFKAALIQTGASRGLRNEQLDTFVSAGLKTRTAKGYGEIAGFAAAGVLGEQAGRATQTALINKYGGAISGKFGKAATLGAFAVAPAGFYEGASGELVQQFSRNEKLNVGKVAKIGGYGAASASILGGAITGGYYANKATVKNVASTIGNVADPYEYFTDRLTDVISPVKIPVLTVSSISITPSTTISNSGYSLNIANSPSFSLTNPNTFIQSSTPSSETNNFSLTPTNQKTSPFSFTPSNTPTNPFTNTPTNPFTNTPTNTETLVNSYTNTPTNSFTPVSSITFKLPAIIPPVSIGGGGGGGDYSKGSPYVFKSYKRKPTVYSILTGKSTFKTSSKRFKI